MESMGYWFVGRLTVRSWFRTIWPRLVLNRFRGRRPIPRCYVIEGADIAFAVARASASLAGVTVERLSYRVADVRDERGLPVALRISYEDLLDFQAQVMADWHACDGSNDGLARDPLPIYVARDLALNRGQTWHLLLLIQVCAWKVRAESRNGHGAIMFLERRPFLRSIERYAARWGVGIVPVKPRLRFSPRAFARRLLGPGGLAVVRALRGGLPFRRLVRPGQAGEVIHRDGVGNPGRGILRPRIAVEYYGQLNLDQPERNSDVFFWQQSSLPGSDLLLTFSLSPDPFDEEKRDALACHGIGAVVVDPRATTLPGAPVFVQSVSWASALARRRRRVRAGDRFDSRWLEDRAVEYDAQRAYWSELFAALDVKVHATWFRFGAGYCAIVDALRAVGGIATVYQRSLDMGTADAAVCADIAFGFSQAGADMERHVGSEIRYYVTTGYLGDHRFPLVRGRAQEVRRKLQVHGAMRIVSFFDENSGEDPRWHTGPDVTRKNYAFLLERLLEEPWLGLVVKPKVPGTLRRRLGPVAELLDRAVATGRCYVFGGGGLGGAVGSYPPAAAALASDIAIHGHLCAATAGFEAALAGVPTLLLDREGWSVSPLYRLGTGRVVFTDYSEMWKACVEHWTSPTGVPGFGDWSPMLDELDPFRDGRAAERMGTYLGWLIEGFREGLDRETVMADAAERYCAIWGKDTIVEVSGGVW